MKACPSFLSCRSSCLGSITSGTCRLRVRPSRLCCCLFSLFPYNTGSIGCQTDHDICAGTGVAGFLCKHPHLSAQLFHYAVKLRQPDQIFCLTRIGFQIIELVIVKPVKYVLPLFVPHCTLDPVKLVSVCLGKQLGPPLRRGFPSHKRKQRMACQVRWSGYSGQFQNRGCKIGDGDQRIYGMFPLDRAAAQNRRDLIRFSETREALRPQAVSARIIAVVRQIENV